MVGDSSAQLRSSADVAAAAEEEAANIGNHHHDQVELDSVEEDKQLSVRGGDELGERSFGGNRWPRQETLALLRIRSDMDQVFRESSLKGPLWEEVSRKLGELGYHRSAKKCKEKFENVYKYHKRTKDGRSGKSEGKSYKFFDQLQALENQNSSLITPPPQPRPQIVTSTTTTPMQPPPPPPSWSCSSTPSPNPINVLPPQVPNPTIPTVMVNSSYPSGVNIFPNSNFQNVSSKLFSSSTSSSTESEEESDNEEELDGNGDNNGTSKKRKRKWKEFFKRLTKEVIKKQEDLQEKFLETIERRENERMAREEAWRIQEVARINQEHEILIKERTTAAAKDAAVISFLQKFSGQQQHRHQTVPQTAVTVISPEQNPNPNPPPPPSPQPPAHQQPRQQQPPVPQVKPANNAGNGNNGNNNSNNNNNNNVMVTSSPISSRWPKAEVEALIRFRTELSHKYHENGPKGPLWEEISAAMRSVGYNRNAKRCKEKWENINKYFKKVKESKKKRSEDSKTCPYFNQLDAIYRERSSNQINNNNGLRPMNNNNSNQIMTEPALMVEPEQQWRPGLNLQQQRAVVENLGRGGGSGQNVGANDGNGNGNGNEEEEEEEEEEDGESTEEEGYEGVSGDGGGGYEMVSNKTAAAVTGSVVSGSERDKNGKVV